MRAERDILTLSRMRDQQAHYQQAAADRRSRAGHHNRRNIMYGGSVGHSLGAGQQSQRAREFEDRARQLASEIDSQGSPELIIDAAQRRMREIVASL